MTNGQELNYTKLKDAELIQLIVENGHKNLIGVLYDRHYQRVFDQCYFYFRDHQKSEDSIQDIFIKIMEKIDTYKGNSSFKTWLSSVTRNYCLDYKRRKKNKQHVWVPDFLDSNVLIEFRDENIEVLFNPPKEEKSIQKVYHIMKKYPDRDSDLLIMKYIEGKTLIEINQSCQHSSMSATKMKIKRTKDRLKKKYLAEYAM